MVRTPFIQSARRWRAIGVGVLVVAGISALTMAQQATSGAMAAAEIIFTEDFPQSNPAHYSITVDTAGHARYECMGRVVDDSEEQPYAAEFEMSARNRERIFEWAKEAKYFADKIDSGNRKLAFTGTKTLSYRDGRRSNAAQYDYSSVEPVRQLTALFQNIASTMEYGQRLTYYHRYQKLGLDEELKDMETQARNNELSEIQGVAPVLQEIFSDTSVINVVRARAKELIQMGNLAAAGR